MTRSRGMGSWHLGSSLPSPPRAPAPRCTLVTSRGTHFTFVLKVSGSGSGSWVQGLGCSADVVPWSRFQGLKFRN
eukprot:2757652-Rhodomonas_salina.1